MKTTPVLALGLSMAVALTACGTAAMQSNHPTPSMDVKDRQPPRPQIRRNPNPTAYEITATIENAPGPFGVVKAAMQYEVLDYRCLPDLGGMAGTRASLLEWVPIELMHVSGDTYRGVIYDDLLVDEDYFGLGVCHWSLVTAQFKLRATEAKDDAAFSYHLFHDDLVSEHRIRAYFWKGDYPAVESIPGMLIPGEEDREKFKPEYRDQLFVLDLAIRKASS
jgi:hypothetical protein